MQYHIYSQKDRPLKKYQHWDETTCVRKSFQLFRTLEMVNRHSHLGSMYKHIGRDVRIMSTKGGGSAQQHLLICVQNRCYSWHTPHPFEKRFTIQHKWIIFSFLSCEFSPILLLYDMPRRQRNICIHYKKKGKCTFKLRLPLFFQMFHIEPKSSKMYMKEKKLS